MPDGRHTEYNQHIHDTGARPVTEKICICGRPAIDSDACSSRLTASFAVASTAHAADWCGGGVWADAMLGSYHIDPDPGTHFNEFNPGLGVECWFNGQWGATVGGFRNSLRRPSYYGGGLWAPEFAHWGFVRIAAIARHHLRL